MVRPIVGRLFALMISLACVTSLTTQCFAEEKEKPTVAKPAEKEKLGLKVPDGFEVTRFADDSQAHDIFSLTFDSHGRVVVSGPGYIKILHDDEHTGRCTRVSQWASVPVGGAQGMYFDGDDCICVGDNAVFRLHGENDKATNPQVAPAKPQMKEHGSHSVRKGPDGWFYYVIGNDPGASEKNVTTKSSPVVKPSRGAIIRFTLNDKGEMDKSEVYADGFRNPYDFDFTPAGNIMLVDSDNERDQYLPWYAPTRLFDVAQGQSHGWLNPGWETAWNRPACFFDSVPRLCEIGRGSPTGGVCYRHRAFPEHYRGGYFSACWSLGKIYYFPLTPEKDGSSYTTKLEVFLEATGASGFAPTGMAVAPDGDLYVAIGGRQTQGGVFRIHYKGDAPKAIEGDDLHQVLNADQPLASWSRAVWVPKAKKLGKEAFEGVALDWHFSDHERVRAIEVLVEVFGGLPPYTIVDILNPPLITRWAWGLSRSEMNETRAENLAYFSLCPDPTIQRSAWEAIDCSTHFRNLAGKAFMLKLLVTREQSLLQNDRYARNAANALTFQLDLEKFGAEYDLSRVRNVWPLGEKLKKHKEPSVLPDSAAQELTEGSTISTRPYRYYISRMSDGDRNMEIVRSLQNELGDVRPSGAKPSLFNGYESEKPCTPSAEVLAQLTIALTTYRKKSDPEIDRELARTFAMLNSRDPSVTAMCVSKFNSLSSPVDDVHFLICIAKLTSQWDKSQRKIVAHALVDLFPKMTMRDWIPSRNWPERVGELLQELCKRDDQLAKAIADDADFLLPDHSLLVKNMPKSDALYAAEMLATNLRLTNRNATWTPELIDALSILPQDNIAPALRKRWEDVGLRDSIAAVLARQPEEEDRDKFRQTLGSVQASAVSSAAKALEKLKSPGSAAEIRAALTALRQFGSEPTSRNVRQDLAALLKHWTGEKIDVDEPVKAKTDSGKPNDKANDKTEKTSPLALYQPWFDWFAKQYPDEAKKLGSGNIDLAAWFKRLDSIDLDHGDKTRGQQVFQQRSCNRCHTGASKLGPDLAGAATRFSKHDLFEAILDPSKDVAPPYRTTSVTDREGQTFIGLVVYESPDATMLQTGPDTIVRLSGIDKGAMRPSRQSLMPTGLLNDASDQDLADLLAFLKSLTK